VIKFFNGSFVAARFQKLLAKLNDNWLSFSYSIQLIEFSDFYIFSVISTESPQRTIKDIKSEVFIPEFLIVFLTFDDDKLVASHRFFLSDFSVIKRKQIVGQTTGNNVDLEET